MWSGVLGFLCTLIIGYLASYILCKISSKSFGNPWDLDEGKKNKNLSVTEEFSDSKDTNNDAQLMNLNLPNPDLFTPILAEKIRKRNEKIMNSTNIQVRNFYVCYVARFCCFFFIELKNTAWFSIISVSCLQHCMHVNITDFSRIF